MAIAAVLASSCVAGGYAGCVSNVSASVRERRSPVWNPLAVRSSGCTGGARRRRFLGSNLALRIRPAGSRRELEKPVRVVAARSYKDGGDGEGERSSIARRCETQEEREEEEEEEEGGVWSKVVKRGAEVVEEAGKRMWKPAMAAMLALALFTEAPDMAFAAGGGRVGGRVGGGSSFSSKSFSAPSRSYSAPSAPSRSYSMPQRQYIAPSPGFSYAVPYAAPSPFFGPSLYAAPAYGIGLGGTSIFFIVILGFIILQAIYGFVSERSEGGSLLTGTQKYSVLKLQVGLLGMARTLQSDLDRIANQANTTTASGLQHLLQETCLALMRHPDYCISGLSSHDIKRSISMGEERFNQLSLEERGKFDEETLVNVNNLRKRMMGKPKAERFNNEYIVVTILVAAEGEFKVPIINGNSDLKKALMNLASIPADSIQAVEVLWTPQNENDTLSERELLRDYPLLRSL